MSKAILVRKEMCQGGTSEEERNFNSIIALPTLPLASFIFLKQAKFPETCKIQVLKYSLLIRNPILHYLF